MKPDPQTYGLTEHEVSRLLAEEEARKEKLARQRRRLRLFLVPWLAGTVVILYLIFSDSPEWLYMLAVVAFLIWPGVEMAAYVGIGFVDGRDPNPKYKNAIEYLNAKRDYEQNTGAR